MTQSNTVNRQFVLAERPRGEPNENTLRLETNDMPKAGARQMLLRNEFLSLDPYMRGRMSDAPSYAAPVEIGGVMVGGTVAQVVSSDVKGFAEGDWVVAFGGWQDYTVSDGAGVINMGQNPTNPSWALGVLGMPGLTAWAGLTQIGQPKAGETLVVAGASGPVGATVGQIGKILGLHVVGIAGGAEKCTHVKDVLGFDLQSDTTRAGLFVASAFALAAGLLVARFITTSKLGKVLIAVRDAESRTRFIGYRVEGYKLFVFVVSAMMAGVAGALYTPQVGIINPGEFSPANSIEIVIWVALGGRGTLVGAAMGAVLVALAKTLLTGWIPEIWLFALGGMFVFVTLFLPTGVLGLIENTYTRLRQKPGVPA